MTYIIGIDPGKSGATAILNAETKKLIMWWNFKDEDEQVKRINSVTSTAKLNGFTIKIILEKVWGFYKKKKEGEKESHQGSSSSFNFGDNFGFHKGVLKMAGYEPTLVAPITWQKKVLGDTCKGDKGIAREYVQRLYPTLKANKGSGVWDAICIALYGVN